ncbi:MAG TPA: RNA methyltransferase [Chitinophagales bacterium]|nr:RNA methyltransferase [Chitinophagales bacterium]
MRKLASKELGRLSPRQFREAEKIPVIIVLDNVRSLYNVGSVFRTADAFRVESIYLCGITATPPHREIHKTALGAEETVNWKHFKETEEAVHELKSQGWKIIAVEQAEGSIPLDEFNPDKNAKLALVFGNEIGGVSETVMKTADACIEIPQTGTKHSLNVAVSVGVVVWEIGKRYK